MIRVNYQGLIADIREEDLKEGLSSLSACSEAERRRILESVAQALDKVLRQVAAGKKLSPRTLQDTANDIGLWFAGEVLAGRADQYQAAAQ